jgi:glutathione S-transferase
MGYTSPAKPVADDACRVRKSSDPTRRAMIIVHHLNQSRSQRILWLLEELKLPYDIAFYQRDEHNMAPASLRAIHSLGKSPIITDGDKVVAESGAIIDYIVRTHGNGRLAPEPSSDEYDDFVYWLHYAEGSAVTPFVIKPIAQSFGKMAAPLDRRVNFEMDLNLSFINQTLTGREYLMGDKLTAADVQMSFVGELAVAGADIARYPQIDRWVKTFQARDAYKTAITRGGYYKFQRK